MKADDNKHYAAEKWETDGKEEGRGEKTTARAAESLLPFNWWVIKIIISQSPSSITEIDGWRSWMSALKPTHTRHIYSFDGVRDTRAFSVSQWDKLEAHEHTNTVGVMFAVMRRSASSHRPSQASARLADRAQRKCPIWRAAPAEMLINRNIGNQFTCAARARSNVEVNIYFFRLIPWAQKKKKNNNAPLRDVLVAHVITWFKTLFSLGVTAVRWNVGNWCVCVVLLEAF